MHTIRLRGPWRYEVLERRAGDQARPGHGKQKLPADWSATLGADFRGTARYTRVFHQPTGLERGQQVWLVVEPGPSALAVKLNDQPLPPEAAGESDEGPFLRFAIGHLLSPTNHLIIDVTHTATASECGGLTGEVRLEIQTVRPRPVD